jgi:hypothetical protein
MLFFFALASRTNNCLQKCSQYFSTGTPFLQAKCNPTADSADLNFTGIPLYPIPGFRVTFRNKKIALEAIADNITLFFS